MLLPNAALIPPQTGRGLSLKTVSNFHDVRGEFEHEVRSLIAFAQQNMGGQAERMKVALNAFVSNMEATNFETNPSSEIFGQSKDLFVEFCLLMQDSRIELKDRIKAFDKLAYSLGGCGAAVNFGLQEAVFGLKSPGNDVHAQMFFESRQRLIDATLQQLVRDTVKAPGSAELNQHYVAVLKNRLGFLNETQYSSDLALTRDAFKITDELVRRAEQAIKKNVSHCHVPLFMAKNILETLKNEIPQPMTVRKLEVKLNELSQQFGKIPRQAVVVENAGALSLATNPSLLARCLLQNLTEIGLCPKQDPVVLCKWEPSANKTRSIAIYGECIPYIQEVTAVGPKYLHVTEADLKKLQAEVAAKNIDDPSPQTMLALEASSASDASQPASPQPRFAQISVMDLLYLTQIRDDFENGSCERIKRLMNSLSKAAYDPEKLFDRLQFKYSGRTSLRDGLEIGLSEPVKEFVEGLAGVKILTSRQKQDILEAKDMSGFHGLYSGVVQGESSTVRGFLEGLSTFEDLSSDQKFEIVQAKARDGTTALEMALQKADNSETVIAILESLPSLELSSQQIQEILSIEKVIGLKLDRNSLITFFRTALEMAVSAEDTETVRVILAAIDSPRLGLDFEEIQQIVCAEDVLNDGKSALFVAFSQTDTDTLSVLLEALPGLGFETDEIVNFLRTGLEWAILEQSPHSVNFILGALSRLDLHPSQNAEFLKTRGDKGKDVLQRTLRDADNPFALAILDAMSDLKLGPDHLQEILNVADLDGFKRLFTLAINEGGTETVKMLLDVLCQLKLSSDQKAEFMGARDLRGETILSRALKNGDTDMVIAVLVAMNDLKLEAHQVQTILEVKNQDGQSAMFDAVWNNHTDTLKVFLESLSNMPLSNQQLENLLTMEDALGQTFSAIAETVGNTELEEALKPLRSKIKAVP
ncbi:MAG: ankyrin repeat domain-containing protein [Alphaproteobacteria bacterium]|nr:ankyrin repeat domain-containing protein [Alphaproteobacteria bacterium]